MGITLDHFRNHLLLFFSFTFIILELGPLNATEPSPLFEKGEELVISGNKRTQESYIKSVLQNCVWILEQSELEKKEKEEKEDIEGPNNKVQKKIKFFKQCLINTKLFSKVNISKKGKKVNIKVVDRWTLIPIPYVRGQGDAKAFGFFLIDTNLFGRGKFITAGGTFGSGGNSGFLMYRDPSLFFSKWNGGFILRNAKQDSYNYNGSTKIEGFQERFISYGGYLGYKIFPKMTLGLNFSKDKKEFSVLDSYSVPQNNDYFFGGVNFSFRGSQYKFYFKEGTDISASFKAPFGETNKGAKGEELKLNISSQWNIIKNHALQLTLNHIQTFSNRFGYALKLGGSKGLRGVPLKGAWALRSSSLSADYQIPVYFSKYGTWTISSFIDGASLQLIKNQIESKTFTSSYGVGATFFIKKVNFPGLGLYYGRNDDFLGNFVSFTLGRGE